MYLEYYGLEQPPFSITPDPHYVFLSEHHRDALAHLLYGIRQGGGGGFVQLTGEVGTGKTTLSRLLLNQLPEGTQAALVLNPRLDPVELMETICEELGLRPGAAVPAATAATATPESIEAAPADTASKSGKGKAAGKRKRAAPAKARVAVRTSAPRANARRTKPTAKALYDLLSAYLLQAYARGERVVLIVDEAQNLSTEALEQIRLLTNLETETQKLLQIILIGQPELREMLMRPELRQLAQRITARYHLPPLDEAGTDAYLRHRLTTAGARRFPFSPDAVRRAHRRSGGVPRLINVIAERALLAGFAHDLLTIDGKTVDRAADEALAPTAADAAPQTRFWLNVAGLAVAIAVFALLLMRWPVSETDALDAASTNANMQTPVSPSILQPLPTSATSTNAASTRAAAHRTDDAIGADALLQALRAASTQPIREWSPLLAAWNAPATLRTASADACPPVPAPGWRCLRSRASLDQLLRIDRPVLLRLRAEPHATWARLIGANQHRVRLSLDGRTLDVDRVALSSVWNGEFLAIWPSPERMEARYAAREPAAVEWVRTRLPDEARSGDLDANMRAFQTRYGWPGDGALRAETLFALAARRTGTPLSVVPSSVAE